MFSLIFTFILICIVLLIGFIDENPKYFKLFYRFVKRIEIGVAYILFNNEFNYLYKTLNQKLEVHHIEHDYVELNTEVELTNNLMNHIYHTQEMRGDHNIKSIYHMHPEEIAKILYSRFSLCDIFDKEQLNKFVKIEFRESYGYKNNDKLIFKLKLID